MQLENLVVVSGLPGIYKMAANRNNGLIIEDIDNGKKRFASARKHQFTPLESISIFTFADSVELKVIFQKMLDLSATTPPVSPKSSANEIMTYFEEIVPDFDRDRVHANDVKKVIKWFNFLNQRNMLITKKATDEEE